MSSNPNRGQLLLELILLPKSMTNTTNNDSSQTNVAQVVDDAMKNFDITKLQAVGYDQIQELAEKYLASEDPEVHALGQELKNIDPAVFQLTPAEESVKKLHDELMSKGKTKEEADMFGIQLLQLAVEKVTQQITGAMNERSYNEWMALQSHSPNVFQNMMLLDQTAKLLLRKSYDDLYEEALTNAVNMATNLLQAADESAKLVEGMTADQAKTIMTAFDNNQYEVAIQLIYDAGSKDATR